MNFLAHYVVAVRHLPPVQPLSLYVCGNALPDLLPLARPRRRLQAGRLSLPPTCAEDVALRAGVGAHLATDAAFHKAGAFAEAQAFVRQLLDSAGFDGVRIRHFFAAHVLSELALDAALLHREPALAAEFYDALNSANVSVVTRWAETKADGPLPGLPIVLSRFMTFRYLHSYAEDAGVAEGFNRLCGRARQDTFEGANWERLLNVTAQAVDGIGAMADRLLTETAHALPPAD